MGIERFEQTYHEASVRASEIGRQLAFVGIAVVWLFSGASADASGKHLAIKGLLLVAGALLVTYLGVDLLHALYRTAAWGIYAHHLNREGKFDVEDAPAWINWASLMFFWGKMTLLLVPAYALLGVHLWHRLS